MLWAIENAARFLEERKAISDLAGRSDWLQNVRWGFTKGALLKVEADIVVAGETHDVELVYPNLFPDTPAYVRPRSSTERWSSHQYGAGGVLCLEWGPDNWSADITGAELLANAHKLLLAERGPDTAREVVPSRHALTLGQEVRASSERLVVTPGLREFLRDMGNQEQRTLVSRSIFHRPAMVTFIEEIAQAGADAFKAPDLPSGILQIGPLFAWRKTGWLFKSEAFSSCGRLSTLEELLAAIRAAGFQNFELAANGASSETDQLVVLVTGDKLCRAISVEMSGEKTVTQCTVIDAGSLDEQRLPAEHSALSEKRVGIVGLGSVGSKVAVSLARCGVRKFLLVDDDVMLDANVCRHELDWTSVGANKVDATKEALTLIAAGIDVQVRRTRIAGQESAESAATALDSLATCDLLIDATANASVFVQLAAIAKRRKKPLIWGEVFAGGIGALLARSRPDQDPEPLAMRGGIFRYLETLPAAPFRAASGYDVTEKSSPLVAYDAEVSQVAAALTGFALDTVLERSPSRFPYSAYLIGFKSEWIFEAPFDTRPILVQADAAEVGGTSEDQAAKGQEAAAVLVELINQQINADASASR